MPITRISTPTRSSQLLAMAYSIETPSGTSSSPTMIQRQIFRRISLAAVSKRLGSGGGTVPIVVSAKMGLSLLAAAGDAGSYACQSGADGKGGGANGLGHNRRLHDRLHRQLDCHRRRRGQRRRRRDLRLRDLRRTLSQFLQQVLRPIGRPLDAA